MKAAWANGFKNMMRRKPEIAVHNLTEQNAARENLSFFSQSFFHFVDQKKIPQEEAAYRVALNSLQEEDRNKISRMIERSLETGVSFQMILKDRKGELIFCETRTEGATLIFSRVTVKNVEMINQYFNPAENLSLPLWKMNEKGCVKYANPAARELLGLREEEIAPFDLERSEIAVIKNGGRSLYRIIKQPEENQEGKQHFICHAFDIRVEKQAEDSCQRLEQGQKMILEGLQRTGAAIFDSKRKLQFYNQAFVRLWDIDIVFLEKLPDYATWLDQLRLKRALPEQRDFKEWREEQLKIFHADEKESFEEMWHLPDHRTMRVALKPYPSGGLIAFFEDCTDRIRLESSYKIAAGNLQESLNALRSGVALFDFYGKMKVCNKNIFLLGKSKPLHETFPENPTFSDLYRYYAEKDEEIGAFWAELVNISQKNGAIKNFERVIACSNGEYVYEARTETAGSGDILVTFTDVTAERVARTALSEKTDALIAASHMRDTFLKHLSYEMRNPMTAVIGFSEALREQIFGKLNPKQSEYVGDILHASRELLHIIDNLLDLVRFQKDDKEVRAAFKPIDIEELAMSAAGSAKRRFPAKNVNLFLIASKDQNAELHGDSAALQQAFFQILLNAFESVSFDNGLIVIQIYTIENQIHVAIRDNGRGMPTEMIEKLNAHAAENYGAEDMIASGVKKGAGFGLNFVKRVCGLHRAELFCASAEKFGTSVKMIFNRSF